MLRGDQFFELIDTMRTAAALLLVLAIVSQLGKYVAQAFAYRAAFATVGESAEPLKTP